MGSPLHTEIALLALVFVLGLRHGLDPDHLVAIDGLTRSNRSPWTGVFFSLGHGVVVTLVGVALALAAARFGHSVQPPAWLEISGTVVSVGMLIFLGVANLRAAPGSPLVSVRGRWLAQRLAAASHPVIIAAIGAAFALSFDTLSHALLFSATGATASGWLFALGLGLVFTLGMMLADAVDGWMVARMVISTRNSRVMAYAIAALCFLIAALGLAKFVQFGLGDWAALAGIGTLAVIGAAWLVARRTVPA